MKVKILFLASILLLSSTASAQWAQFQGDARHTGRSHLLSIAAPEVAWKGVSGASLSSQAVFGMGKGFVGGKQVIFGPGGSTEQGVVIAFNPETGQLLWTYPEPERVTTPAVDGAGNIYVASEGGVVLSLTSQGQKRWRAALGGHVNSSVAMFGSDLYISTMGGDSRLYCLDIATGTIRWQTDTVRPGLDRATPAVEGGVVTVFTVNTFGPILHGTVVSSFNQRDGSTRFEKGLDGFDNGAHVAVTADAQGTVYGHTHKNPFFSAGRIFAVRSDGSGRWSRFRDDVDLWYSSFALSFDESELYVGTSKGLRAYRTIDGEEVWKADIGSISESSPAVDRDGNIFVGTDAGSLYAFSPSGVTLWSLDLGVGKLGSPSIGPGGKIYVTGEGGKLVCVGGMVVTVELTSFVATDFSLEQNYPNPFNASTTVKFALPRTGHVTLKVYDAAGREVVTLVEGTLQAEMHEVTFDASKLPSGIYFYQLQAGSFSTVRRMLFLK